MVKIYPHKSVRTIGRVAGKDWKGNLRIRGSCRHGCWSCGWNVDWELVQSNKVWNIQYERWWMYVQVEGGGGLGCL